MLMVIFGAGASFDSCATYRPFQALPRGSTLRQEDVENCRPPLARNLFDNRDIFVNTLEEFPQCKPIVPRLRDPVVQIGKISIEKRLEEVREEAKTYPGGRQELAAVRCYLQRAVFECEGKWRGVTKGVTNHLELLREIVRTNTNHEPVCLVTFNYDMLLEDALCGLGPEHGIGKMEDYTAYDHLFRLFKLHGSVNWGLEFDNPPEFSLNPGDWHTAKRVVVDQVWQLRKPEAYVFCEVRKLLSRDNRPVFPAIAIPLEDKSEFQCPNPMLDALRELLPKVSRIITIGWRASEAHFLKLLDTSLKPGVPIFVVAGNQEEANKIVDQIRQTMRSRPPTCRGENAQGFTDFIRSGLAIKILEA